MTLYYYNNTIAGKSYYYIMTLVKKIVVFTRLTFNAHLLHPAAARERLTVNAIRNNGGGTENL